MISYPLLGKYGRLGNQLFQFASTYAASRKTGTICRFPPSGHSLQDFNIPDDFFSDEMTYKYVYRDNEQDFTFNPALHQLPPETAITGYLQNPRNFVDFRTEIIDMLNIKPEIKDRAKDLMKVREKSVSVHIRRGDYLNIQDVLPCQSNEYYNKAVGMFEDHTPIIFTDDPSWCKENFSWEIMHNDVITDFACMTFCDGHVMSNSSFSWWVSYITGRKTVAPVKWFGNNGVKNWNDLYLEKWIKI